MAGHSKWANIKHKKGKEDEKRGKVFSKLARDITVAARNGCDISMNPALRLAVDKANQQNMPKDTIKKAIEKGAGLKDGSNMTVTRYEGYGPAGTAFWVHCITENINRTVAEVRHAFSKHGGNLGANGSTSFKFEHLGKIMLAKNLPEEEMLNLAISAGAINILTHEDCFEVQTTPENYEAMIETADKNAQKILARDLTWFPKDKIELNPEQQEKVTKLISALEDLDDVQEVFTDA